MIIYKIITCVLSLSMYHHSTSLYWQYLLSPVHCHIHSACIILPSWASILTFPSSWSHHFLQIPVHLFSSRLTLLVLLFSFVIPQITILILPFCCCQYCVMCFLVRCNLIGLEFVSPCCSFLAGIVALSILTWPEPSLLIPIR